MVQPPYLNRGDRAAIVATAGKIDAVNVAPAIAKLEAWGLEVVTGKHLYDTHFQFAGTDAHRAADLQAAIDDPAVKAIVCARGGYGSVRILDQVDFSTLEQHPKWLIGYSDVTALHAHLHTQHRLETLHATMPINYPKDVIENTATTSLHAALFGNRLKYDFAPYALNRAGTATGIVTGGNLSVLHSLRGTPSDLDLNGKILFLEDLNEYLYHTDRMLQNLKHSGALANLAGLLIGSFTDMKDNASPFGQSIEAIILSAVAEHHFPVAFNFPAGHQDDNRALIFGRQATLTVGTGSQLLFDGGSQ